MTRTFGLIPAAGKSRRMGRPKLMLPLGDSTVLEQVFAAVRKAVEISAFGGFLVVQQAARRMIPRGNGAILLTGASASIKGYPHSAAFAMGKFALRGLAQSTARVRGRRYPSPWLCLLLC